MRARRLRVDPAQVGVLEGVELCRVRRGQALHLLLRRLARLHRRLGRVRARARARARLRVRVKVRARVRVRLTTTPETKRPVMC